jgi:hypothetical protein
MRKPVKIVAGVAFAVAALSAGCGGGSSDDTTSPTSGPPAAAGSSTTAKTGSKTAAVGFTCPTASAVSTAVGHDVAVEGEQSNKYCKFSFKDAATSNSITAIYTWASFDLTEDPGVADPEPVSGIGERAIWDDGGNNLTVWTGKGSVNLNFLAIGFPAIDQKRVAVELAKLVL